MLPTKAFEFVDSKLFDEKGALKKYGESPLPALPSCPKWLATGSVEFTAGPTLTRDEELHFFLILNFAKRLFNRSYKRRPASAQKWFARVQYVQEYIARRNMGLVFNIVSRSSDKVSTVGSDEAVSVAQLGLLQSMNRFNAALGNKFSTYAWPAIANAVAGAVVRANRISNRAQENELSEDVPAVEETDEYGEEVDRLKIVLRDNLAGLTPVELQVLRCRFELDGYERHTLEETGETINVSKERARQIQAVAMEKLKTFMTPS